LHGEVLRLEQDLATATAGWRDSVQLVESVESAKARLSEEVVHLEQDLATATAGWRDSAQTVRSVESAKAQLQDELDCAIQASVSNKAGWEESASLLRDAQADLARTRVALMRQKRWTAAAVCLLLGAAGITMAWCLV
jgi:hypothetical protein